MEESERKLIYSIKKSAFLHHGVALKKDNLILKLFHKMERKSQIRARKKGNISFQYG